MPKLDELTIIDFAEELGSVSPAPGGGSTAALAGVLACSLVNMVSKISLKNIEPHDSEMKNRFQEIINDSAKIKNRLLKLINDDTKAFNKLLSTFKLPKNKEAERTARITAIQNATKHAAEIPLRTAELSSRVLSLVGLLAKYGSKNAITDTGVAGLMAYCSITGAVWNVKINLRSIKDEIYVKEKSAKLEEIITSTQIHWEEIRKLVESCL